MKRLGLIGFPLSHSFSQRYFTEKFQQEGLQNQYRYDNYPLKDIAEFPPLIARESELVGLNVTIPYKEQVIPFLDTLDPKAAAIGAVNTIAFQEGKLKGYNTDVIGFGNSLDEFLQAHGGPSSRALILGTGGAAKGIAQALIDRGVVFDFVSRRTGADRITYADLDEKYINRVDLIINTTPLGMTPDIASCPDIPYHCLSSRHRVYDLVYNPAITLFMQRAQAQGAATINGLPMLTGQAEAAWQIWQASLHGSIEML